MADNTVAKFVETYGPIAQQVSKQINVDPNVLISQWAIESGWGKSEMAKKHHNLGGVKDFSGKGFEAKDSKTGSVDKYVMFEDPEVFGMYYVDQIRRNFPYAMNSGPDAGAFARGLASGKHGAYFEIDPKEYARQLITVQASIPEDKQLPFEPTVGKPSEAPEETTAPPEQETDAQRDARIKADMNAQEIRQAQLLGGGVGLGIAGLRRGASSAGNVIESAATRAGSGFRAGMQGALPGGAPGAPAAVPGAPAATPQGGLPAPRGTADAGRMPRGQTGAGTYNYGKAFGLTDIEAGRALDMTKQAGGVHDLSTIRREGTQRVGQLFPSETWRENPRYGGMLTIDQGAGGGPRATYTQAPEGELRQLPQRVPVSTAPVQPSGLQQVANLYRRIIDSTSSAMQPLIRYVAPPLALASAAGEGTNIAQQFRKPEEEQDMLSAALSAANILGSGMSMSPATARVGIPLAIGTSAVQAYRDNPEFKAYINKKLGSYGDRAYPSSPLPPSKEIYAP